MRGLAHGAVSEQRTQNPGSEISCASAQVAQARWEIGDGWLTVFGASENNLKDVNAAFPVGCLTCVTGVSGSGKSTLVNDILRAVLARDLNGAKERPELSNALSHRAV